MSDRMQQQSKITKWPASKLFALGATLLIIGWVLFMSLAPWGASFFGGLVMLGGGIALLNSVYKLLQLMEWYMLTGRD